MGGGWGSLQRAKTFFDKSHHNDSDPDDHATLFVKFNTKFTWHNITVFDKSRPSDSDSDDHATFFVKLDTKLTWHNTTAPDCRLTTHHP